jgi:hypothetical protein
MMLFMGGSMRLTCHVVAVAATALSVVAHPAMAIQLSQSGNAATLSGPINDGDQFILRDFLARPEAAGLRAIYLHSPGGRVDPAREMARLIRAKGLATIVDASRHRCNSACTGLFTAGVTRHYVNAGGVRDAEGGPDRGIGFHEGNNRQSNGQRGYSGGATAQMINTYYEMGVPGAANLVTRSAFNSMFHISAQTAIENGVATSLSLP